MADARDYDFQIGDLCFRGATSDRFPYVRATAPFRKEQVDQSQRVGDQSLTGWWTRGQLSFHKGAGLNYYEVLDGEEVLDRFDSSVGVQIFAPGEVTLDGEMKALVSTPGDVKQVEPGTNLAAYFMANSGSGLDALYSTTPSPPAAATPVALTGTDVAAYAIATDGATTYVATNDWGVSPSVGRIEAFGGLPGGTVLYEQASLVWRGLWFAKGRIWALDADGALYALPAEAGTVSTPILTMPDAISDGTPCHLTESGGAVFLSVGTNVVYKITLDADGGVPTLSAPIAAATLPLGENISAMRFYLGSLVLVTTRGVRVAAVSENEAVTFGPHTITWGGNSSHHHGTAIAATGATVFVAGEIEPENAAVFEISLEAPIGSSLQFPYRRVWDFPAGVVTNNKYGVVEFWFGVAVYGPDIFRVAYALGDKEPSGELTTAYHRFGTLEPKNFQSISVRVGGDGGSVAVYLVHADGTVDPDPLGVIAPGEEPAPLPLNIDGAVERVALRFILTRGAINPTEGPTLLGYQIKALPVPERQRILRWPLLLHDVLRLRRGAEVGRRDKALEDIQALEALESTSAVVTYTDHRTRETGSAYIDSVEFQSDTPASKTTSGFGGIAYVTLRVLS